MKAFEHQAQLVVWDSGSLVNHMDISGFELLLDLQFDRRALWCVLDGVIQKVRYCLKNQGVVGVKHSLVRDFNFEFDAFIFQ